jgi:hypothetical protein
VYYNPRSAVPVPEELSDRVFPWVRPCWEKVKRYEVETKDMKPTATAFFTLMSSLATVLIQDVAALKLMHPDRCGNEYPLFKDNPIFNSDEFEVRFVFCLWSLVFFLL